MATTADYEPSRHVQRFLTRVEGTKADRTHRNRKTDLKDFELWLRDEHDGGVTDVEPLDIEDYIIHLSNEGYASTTMDSRFYSLKSLYGFLADKLDVMDETPFEAVDRSDLSRLMNGTKKAEATREEISYVTPEQVEQLADNASEPRLRNELLIRLMFQTGVREGELVSIRLEDIDRDERSIQIRASKTDTNRTVFYQSDLDFLLNQWTDGGYRSSLIGADGSPYLFVSDYTSKLEKQRMNKVVKEAAEEAGIQETMYTDNAGHERKKITSHALRHGHAVEALKSGIDVRTVQKHLGHASLDMTMRYLNLIDDDVREAYRAFGD
jgi:integrase/recombinase XerD